MALACLSPLVVATTSFAQGLTVERLSLFNQTAAATVTADATPFSFRVNVRGGSVDMSAWGPKFYTPGSAGVPQAGASADTNTGTLNFPATPNNLNDYAFTHEFATDADMLAFYPVAPTDGGNYGIKFLGASPPSPAVFTSGLSFSGGAYPSVTPQVASANNGAAWTGGSLVVKPSGVTTVVLNTFPEYTTSTYGALIGAGVYDSSGNVIASATANSYYIPSLSVTQPAITQVVLNGSELTAGVTYTLEVQYGILASPLGQTLVNGTNFQGLSAYYKNTVVAITADATLAIVTSPANRTVVAGAGANFTVLATGAPAPSYQWQRLPAGGSTWADLSNDGTYGGTTTATLSVTGTTLAMRDDQFRVVVSNTSGSVTSGAATLTVTGSVSANGNAISYGTSTFPATAAPGADVTFTYGVANAGTQAWVSAHHLSLRASDGTYLTFPSLNGVAAGDSTVASFTFTAPSAPGVHTYYVQAQQDGVEVFGPPVALSLTVPVPVTAAGNAISYNSTTFPATATPGAAVVFNYAVTNAGTSAWGAGHHLSLRTSNGDFLMFPSLNGVAAGGSTVANFTFNAPATPGVYTYYVEALQDGVEVFGLPIALTLTVPAPVSGSGNAIDYGMTTFPTTATPGAVVSFAYNVTNSGTLAWGSNHHLSLRTSDGAYLTFPSLSGVAAGDSMVANFTFNAPATPGVYTYYVEALQDGVEVFGLPIPLTLTVPVAATGSGNAITFNSTTFPTTATAGAALSFTYNVTNSGTQAWGTDHHLSLRTSDGTYLTFPSLNGVAVGGGKVASFTFNAPSTPGVYTYYVEALQDGVEVFGLPIPLTLTVPVPVTGSGNGISYNTTTFPATAAAGSTVFFTYNVSNTGTQAWGTGHHLSLRSSDGTYLTFPSLDGVAAGGGKIATFTFNAPAAPGVYTYYVEALQDGVEVFGLPIALTLTVPEPATSNGNAVRYNTTTFPATAAAGSTVFFSYNVTNTGTQAWGTDHHLSLRTSDDTYLVFPQLDGVAVGGGKIATFTFNVPSTPGVYTYYVQAQQDGVETFGLSIPLKLTVPEPVTSNGNAINYGMTTFPTAATAGAAVTFTYSVTNTGTQAWGTDHHLSLRTSGGTYLTFPPLNGVAVNGGKIASFTFTAPSTPGTYTYYVQAQQDGVETFGLSIPVTLTVSP